MNVSVKQITGWERVVDAARFTVNKNGLGHEPSDKWKRMILLSEHSPLRLLEFDIKVYDIPYYVAMHLVRHFMGVEKFVTTQREDRTESKKPRSQLAQDAPVNVQFSVNAQALISISRKRLCNKAHPETIKVWKEVRNKIMEIDPVMAHAMVPECYYRGFCPEAQSCGKTKTDKYRLDLEEYRAMQQLFSQTASE